MASKYNKVWDDAPTTFTEFGPLSSEVKPSGGFLSRFFRRGKDDADNSGSSSQTGSAASSREGSLERCQTVPHSSTSSRITYPVAPLTPSRAGRGSGMDAGECDDVISGVVEEDPILLDPEALKEEIEKDEDILMSQENPNQTDESEDDGLGEKGDHDLRMPHHRTLSNVLSRLSNILDRRSTTPQTYKDSDFKQYWMPDRSCRQCYDCGDKFTTFRRRHHCRICGQIFCSKCCNQELPGKIIGYKGGIRVCDYCCKVVLRYAQQTVSTGEVKVIRDDINTGSSLQLESDVGSLWSPIVQHGSLSREELTLPQHRSNSSPDMAGTLTDKAAPPFDLTPQSEFPSQESLYQETKKLIQDSMQLRALWRQLVEADTGIEMQTHRVRLRTHQNCIVGRDLVDWLIRNDIAVKRDQAVAIGQALLYAGYIEPLGNQMNIFRDEFTLYKPGESATLMETQTDTQVLSSMPEERESSEPLWFREIDMSEDTDDGRVSAADDRPSSIAGSECRKSFSSESDARTLSVSERSETGSVQEIPKLSLASKEVLDEPLPRQDSLAVGMSAMGLPEEVLKGAMFLSKAPVPSSDIVTCPQGWRTVDQLREENGEKLAYERLKQAHTEHWQVVTRQLLSQQGLSASWEVVILNCVRQISHFVRPDVRSEADDLDVRRYVHIKKIPVGQKHDTSLIHGLMFTKNIAHKKMHQQITNPRILLLRGAIEYQRVENKFSSLEPQILQEKEFLKNSVAKIVAFHPSIVVVEKSVSRLAQEFLLDAGITLVFNVKPTVMERLARFTQADIVPSIDGLVRPPNLGFCHNFQCLTYALPNKENKTVVKFDGCATHLGCTISLTGASFSELKRVKLILRFMTLVAYNSLLELCFAMDEFAMPPPGSEELLENMEGFESSVETMDEDIDTDEKETMKFLEMKENIDPLDAEWSVIDKSIMFEIGETQVLVSHKELSVECTKDKENNMEYTSLTEVMPEICHMEAPSHVTVTLSEANEKDEDHREVNGDDPSVAVQASPGVALRPVDSSIKRQLSAMMELTDCSDPLLGYQKNQDDSIFKRSQSIQFQEQKQTSTHLFRHFLQNSALSISPYIKYSVPFLESEVGARCFARDFLPQEIYWSALFTGERAPKEQRLSKVKYVDMDCGTRYAVKSNIKITEAHQFVLSEMTAPAAENSMQTLIADFRARGGRIHVLSGKGKVNGISRDPSPKASKEMLEESLLSEATSTAGICWEKKTDCLDIHNHQRLAVLFSSYSYRSPNHPNPCVYPWVVTMEYYGRSDITLGGFLERFCFRESYTCPSQTCEVPMIDHIRRFAHGHGCINVLLKKLDNPIAGAQDSILMWSWCRRCKQVTPVVPISADTWNLSFAKYLDLRFHCTCFHRRGSAEPCTHSLHLDHYQYFGHKDIVTSFKSVCKLDSAGTCTAILMVEIILPKLNAEEVMDAIKRITNKGMDRFSLILEITMKLKADMAGDSTLRTISDFLTEQQTEKGKFRETATNIQHRLTPEEPEEKASVFEIQDSLVLLKRMISESVQHWNTRLQDFMTNQQRRSKGNKKEKELISSCDELEKALQKSGEERTSQILASGECQSLSVETKIGEDPKPAMTSHGSNPSLTLVQPEVPKEGQTIIKTDEAEDSADSWFSDLRGATRRWLSSTGFTPIAMPFDACEHHLLTPCERVPIVVYDQEPSSIMLMPLGWSENHGLMLEGMNCCSSGDYQVKLRDIVSGFWGPSKLENAVSSPAAVKGAKVPDTSVEAMLESAGRKASSGVLSFLRGAGVSREPSPKLARKGECIDSVRYTPRMDWDSLEDDSEGFTFNTGTIALPDGDKAKAGKQLVNPHIELQFSDNTARFYCRIYFAEQFRKLRKLIFPAGEEMFIRSLSRCKPWDAKGGKSGSAFCKTDDDRLIMKQMSSMEVESFEKFGPQYFQYVTKAHTEKTPTALAKILGVYRIGFRNTHTNSALKQDLLVMENLFYNRKISQKFDLKGSVRNRLVNTAGKQGEEELVLLDENLLKMSVDNPLYLRPHSKTVLKSAITNDSNFLSTNLVMDYSLLLGLDEGTKELVVGIIDYIRTFTWDKKLEMVVKSAGILGGQGRMPTVVSPQLYKERFLEAMNRYFLHVPDQWHGLGRDFPAGKEKES
ncbi:1-phosphatidylinositol 3-phosphate 5-kinase-like [Pomacea canaliculata]|uniref:1-phosphatidylinositol 3-phosphate 5-kinase-like n=1 Tax=Pomacea canaliculata TaxID=400727 RepID=UPI000D726501|nr:1-phosphatidylinositol 3-phosphate 5-kinase-like [Pomacea canaliculata]